MSAKIEDLPPILFIDFDDFKKLKTFPRYPEDQQLCVALDKIDREKSFLVFISHCWLRGWPGAPGYERRPHPDNISGGKYALCVDGIEKIWHALAPLMENVYVWLDYGCINQNHDPAGELKQLDKIVEASDCMLTPICDDSHENWELRASASWFEGYKSPGWRGTPHSYLSRGWCRIEMFYAANIPVPKDSPTRLNKFAAGLKFQRQEGRRPHILYGSKEKADLRAPIILPPLQYSFFDQYHPEKGTLTREQDRLKIRELVKDLLPYVKKVERKYEGEFLNGQRHGKGIYYYPEGTVYDGEWKMNKKTGSGKYHYVDGAIYEGEWQNDKIHGKGLYQYSDGSMYQGSWEKDRKEGKGKFILPAGSFYDGDWKNDKRNGSGLHQYKDGGFYEGEWKNDLQHGKGKYHFASDAEYEGDWVLGKMEGNGKYTHPDRNYFEGSWKDSQMDGPGKFTFADGSFREGDWKNDCKEGKFLYQTAAGIIFEEEWKDDKNVFRKATNAKGCVVM
jgi:hypothetical protein